MRILGKSTLKGSHVYRICAARGQMGYVDIFTARGQMGILDEFVPPGAKGEIDPEGVACL